jgi:hypothetical protein
MKHRRLMLTAVLLPLFMTIPVFSGAQFDLVPGQGGDKEHASWKITLEPAKLAPGAHGEIVASYQTTKGWYLYAPEHAASTGMPTSIKISFTGSGAAGAKLDKKLIYPAPKKKVLELFDEPETHLTLEGKGQIRQGFVVPKDAPAGKLEVKVALSYMVCSDLLCDPKAVATENLVAMIGGAPAKKAAPAKPKDPAAQQEKPAAGIELESLLGSGPASAAKHAKFELKVSQAEIQRGGTAELIVRYTMARNWYIYSPDHISPSDPPLGRPFEVTIPEGQVATGEGELTFPPSQKKNMGDFGAGPEIHSVLKNTGEIRLPLRVSKNAKLGKQLLKIELSFMACEEKTGICDPPATKTHSVSFTVSEKTGSESTSTPSGVKPPPDSADPSEAGGQQPSAKKKSLFRIILGMGIFGLTMATPFVLLALFPGWLKSMPRSGVWMHTVKVFLGFLEIAAALKFFSNADIAYFGGEDFLISRQLFLILWAAIFLAAGIYLVGIHRLFKNVSLPRIASGLLVTTLSVYFFTCSAPRAELDRLTTALAPPPPPAPEDSSKPVIVKDDFDEGIRQAKARGDKLTLINFTGFT